MPNFTQGKWIYDEPFGVIFSEETFAVIANVQGAGTGSCFCLTQEGQANARLIAHAPVMYGLLKDFVNPEIPADSITYQVLQTATAELLNNIDRRKDSNTGTGHSAPHLTDEEAVATNARLIACAPELYKLLKEELIPTSDYEGTLSFAREAKIRKVLDYIDGKEGD